MGKYKRLLSNTAILGAGTFTSKVLVFLLMPLYTALLSTEQFGTADILMQTANLIIPLAVLGINDGLFRFALDAGDEKKKQIFTNMLFVYIAGIIPLAIVIQLLRLIDVFSGYIWLVFFYICAANLHSLCANYIRACNKTKTFALQGILNTAFTIVLNVLFLVVFNMGVLGYVLSVAIADLITTVFIFFFNKLYGQIVFEKPDTELITSILKFSLPYIPTTLMWMITSASDRFIVSMFSGVAENGLYAAAYKIPTLISLAGTVFIEAWQFSSVNDAAPSERTKFFGRVYKSYTGIMFIGTSALIALSKVFTVLLLDDAYYSSWQYVPVLGIAMLFSAFSSFMGSVYFVEKRSERMLLTASIGALTNVVLNFVLIPQGGAMGASVATVISYVVMFIIRNGDTAKYIKFDLCIPRIIINAIALIAQTVIMIAEPRGWVYWQIAFAVFFLLFNGKDLLQMLLDLLKKEKK